MSRLLVTLFTDASWCPETQAGGWAAWFKENGIARRYGGAFKDRYPSAGLVEAAALVNGLYCVAKMYDNAAVIAQTDCLEAMEILRAPASMKGDAIRRQWGHICTTYHLRVQLRHVKAHRGNADPRAAINNWCDKEAKGHMRRMRHELQQLNQEASLEHQ